MLRLQARLRKLEARLTDGSGLRPHSPEWLDYWTQRLDKILSGEDAGAPGCIPLEVWDAVADGDPAQLAAVTGEDSSR